MDQMNPFIFFPARVFQINQINLSNTLKNIGRDGILLWKISKTIFAIKGVLAIKISLIAFDYIEKEMKRKKNKRILF